MGARCLFLGVTVLAAGALVAQPSDADFRIVVTEEMIRHSRIRDILFFGGFLYSAGVLLLVLMTRLSARLRDAAARVTRRPFLTSILYAALLIIVLTLLELPLTYYASFVVPHQFQLSNQDHAEWFTDQAKALAIAVILGSIIGALAIAALQHVKRWWLAIWLGSIPLMVLLVVIAPVFLDPVFNKFEPLKDEVLRRDLLSLAERAGVEGSRVYEVDK